MKKEILTKIIKILMYALSLFGGSYLGSSCTAKLEINNENHALSDLDSCNYSLKFPYTE